MPIVFETVTIPGYSEALLTADASTPFPSFMTVSWADGTSSTYSIDSLRVFKNPIGQPTLRKITPISHDGRVDATKFVVVVGPIQTGQPIRVQNLLTDRYVLMTWAMLDTLGSGKAQYSVVLSPGKVRDIAIQGSDLQFDGIIQATQDADQIAAEDVESVENSVGHFEKRKLELHDLDHVELSPTAKANITELLNKIPPKDAKTWIDELKLRDRRIVGTRYSDVANVLSYNDFVALYKAIGYEFNPQDWMDYGCVPLNTPIWHTECAPMRHYTCDPIGCEGLG